MTAARAFIGGEHWAQVIPVGPDYPPAPLSSDAKQRLTEQTGVVIAQTVITSFHTSFVISKQSTVYLILFMAPQLNVCRVSHLQAQLDQTVLAVQSHAVGDEGHVSRRIFSR